jgi:hypothetical protein
LSFIRSSPDRAKEMGQLFTSGDGDGRGKLSVDELGTGLGIGGWLSLALLFL